MPVAHHSSLITILGAGPVGSLLSIYLSQRGYQVKVYEKRADPREAVKDEGRSINLAISYRGLSALREVGLEQAVLNESIPMKGRMIHDEKGQCSFQPYGKEGQLICSVSRAGLNKILIEYASQQKNIEFFFNRACSNVNPDSSLITFEDGTKEQAEAIIGADGAFSVLRKSLEGSGFTKSKEEALQYAYKELHISAADGEHAMEKNALHIWPRKKFMLIALPNTDGSFTCTLFLPHDGENSFSTIKAEQNLAPFFKKNFPDIVSLIPDLEEQYFTHPESSLHTLYAFPWARKKTMLIGDAAHAIVPFYGQGMNAGFEDCSVLNAMMDDYDDIEKIFRGFQERRKRDTDAIAELALKNFIEMRDLVADHTFLLRKKIEAYIHEQYPAYLPLYSMVTFSATPYSEALQKGNEHDAIMDRIMQLEGIEDFFEEEKIRKVVLDVFKNASNSEQ